MNFSHIGNMSFKESAFFIALSAAFIGAVVSLLVKWAGVIGHFILGQSKYTLIIDQKDDLYNVLNEWIAYIPTPSYIKRYQFSTKTVEYLAKRRSALGKDLFVVQKREVFNPESDLSFQVFPKTPIGYFKYENIAFSVKEVRDDIPNVLHSSDESIKKDIEITIWSRNKNAVKYFAKILSDFKMEQKKEKGSIYISDSSAWVKLISRKMRPAESVVLPNGILEGLIKDTKQFLEDKEWYQSMGIPWRRGYLFYGLQGTGKSSIVQALAGELGLDIYVLRISDPNLTDNSLDHLFKDMPSPCIVSIEDIEVAFTDKQLEKKRKQDEEDLKKGKPIIFTNAITQSGLRNSLDGPTAVEGRILILNTNRKDLLDPILIRPGRVDVEVEFTYATKEQLIQLWERFYPGNTYQEKDIYKYLSNKQITMGQWQAYLLLYRSDAEMAYLNLKDWDPELQVAKKEE